MRDKLRKRIALSAVTALTLFAAVPVYADTYDAVYDDAALLSDEEQQSLSEEITNLQETTGWEIFALTTEDAQGKTAREYADACGYTGWEYTAGYGDYGDSLCGCGKGCRGGQSKIEVLF